MLLAVTLLACGAGYWLWSGNDGTPAGDEGSGRSARDSSGLELEKLGSGHDQALVAERAALRGTVRDPEGAPIAGAHVCAVPRSRKLLGSDVHSPFCATTEADGTYRLGGLFPGQHFVGASAPEYKPGYFSPGEGTRGRYKVSLLSGAERSGVDIVLKPGGAQVLGTVRDISGGVLEGAQVWSDGALTLSDEEGRFSLWVGPGVTTVKASAEGYTESRERGAAPGHDFELLLTPESVLVGQVVLAGTKTPVAGINVESPSSDPLANEEKSGSVTITDASGSFRIGGLDPGIYKPTAFDDEHYGIAAAQVHLGLGETSDRVLIEVHPAFAVSGSIVPDDGETCDLGTVSLFDDDNGRSVSGTTESDGEFHLQGVLPGTYTVHVGCEGYISEETYEPLTVTETISGLRFSVIGGRTIRGQVVTAAGEPAAGMRIVAIMKLTGGLEAILMPDMMWIGSSTESLESADDGSFVISGLKPGTHMLSVIGDLGGNEPIVEVPEGSDVDGVKVELNTFGSVKGRVVDGQGQPVGNTLLVLDNDESYASSLTRDDGTFEIEHVAPGIFLATVSQGDDDPQGVEVRVEVGETTEIELRIEVKSASIRGQVVDAGGGPVTDAFLSATRENDSATEFQKSNFRRWSRWGAWWDRPVLSEQDGSFTLEGLTDGTYTVRAYRKGGGEGFVEGVSADSEVTVTITETGTLAGIVVDASGRSPEEFDVMVTDRESGYDRTDNFYRTGGAFSLDELPGGTYEVFVRAGSRSATSTKITLEDGEELRDLELELAVQVSVRGRIVDLDTGEGIAGVEIIVSSSASDRSGLANMTMWLSDADGEFEVKEIPTGEVKLVLRPGSKDYESPELVRILPAEPNVQDLGTIELVKKKRVADAE